MTETLHPGGLSAISTPEADTVLLVGPNHDSVEIERDVLWAIAREHCPEQLADERSDAVREYQRDEDEMVGLR